MQSFHPRRCTLPQRAKAALKSVSKDSVREYYAHFGEREWLRLTNPAVGAVEFALTCHMLTSYLPPSGRILDIGGGPGRYTLWFAQRGYQVVLADLSPELLRIARAKIAEAGVAAHIEAVVEADACDLHPWSAESFDAALCLGPFYHLPDADNRQRAASELRRVLRPGGLAFVAFMPRLTFIRRTLALPDERPHLSQPAWLAQLLNEGRFENDIPGRFSHGYGAQPEEIAPFFSQFGFRCLCLLAAESICGGLQGAIAALVSSDPAGYQAARRILIQVASDPSILGLSNHLLYIGRKE
jgi:SAM-dependent methyltransferase